MKDQIFVVYGIETSKNVVKIIFLNLISELRIYGGILDMSSESLKFWSILLLNQQNVVKIRSFLRDGNV